MDINSIKELYGLEESEELDRNVIYAAQALPCRIGDRVLLKATGRAAIQTGSNGKTSYSFPSNGYTVEGAKTLHNKVLAGEDVSQEDLSVGRLWGQLPIGAEVPGIGEQFTGDVINYIVKGTINPENAGQKRVILQNCRFKPPVAVKPKSLMDSVEAKFVTQD